MSFQIQFQEIALFISNVRASKGKHREKKDAREDRGSKITQGEENKWKARQNRGNNGNNGPKGSQGKYMKHEESMGRKGKTGEANEARENKMMQREGGKLM